MRNYSIAQKIERISGLVGTKDISEWEETFLRSILERTHQVKDTSMLTEKQIDIIDRIHDKHFA